jgi:hypothetical protein
MTDAAATDEVAWTGAADWTVDAGRADGEANRDDRPKKAR